MFRIRRSALAAGAAVLAAVPLALVLHSTARAADNLVVNPGLEAGSLTGWSCSGSTGHVVGSPTHSGAFALTATPEGQDTARCQQDVTVVPSSAYDLSAFVQGNFTFLGVSGTGTQDSQTWATASSYTRLAIHFTTGPSTQRVTVYVNGWFGQGPYLADDFVLAGPGDAPAQPPTTPPTDPTDPTDPPTDPTDPPSQPPSNNDIPEHELTGYWQDFDNGATPLRLREVNPAYDIIAVAFGEADRTRAGAVTFQVDPGLSSALGGYTDAEFRSDIATLHARGKVVVLSIGGQNGQINLTGTDAVANFVDSMSGLMSSYGFDGVDIDLENGITVTSLTNALRGLRARVGSSLVLTMAPQTLDVQPGGGYLQVIRNVKDIVTVVHTQYYNSGSMLGRDGNVYSQGNIDFITALADLLLEDLRPDQVALGLPASSRAAGGGVVAPSVVANALRCLATGQNCGDYHPVARYPSIRGAMTWSINWDASNGDAFSSTVRQALNGLP